MAITKGQIEHVAGLARLDLTEQEKEKFTKELANIIEIMNKLNEVDTVGVIPTAHVRDVSNVFREDIVKESSDRDAILSNAPVNEDGCVKVPKIVE